MVYLFIFDNNNLIFLREIIPFSFSDVMACVVLPQPVPTGMGAWLRLGHRELCTCLASGNVPGRTHALVKISERQSQIFWKGRIHCCQCWTWRCGDEHVKSLAATLSPQEKDMSDGEPRHREAEVRGIKAVNGTFGLLISAMHNPRFIP